MTLGANCWPLLCGVFGPEAPALPAPPKPCCPPKCGPAPSELGTLGWPGCNEFGVPAAPSPEGRGLLRESTSCVCEEVGVAWAEPDGDCVAPPWEGEEVPEFESFFLEDLLSFARESCSC
jgi:hypothetical protein